MTAGETPAAALVACGKPTKHSPHEDCVGIPLPPIEAASDAPLPWCDRCGQHTPHTTAQHRDCPAEGCRRALPCQIHGPFEEEGSRCLSLPT